MLTTDQERQAVQRAAELEVPMRAVEDRLAALSQALHSQDAADVDRHASALHAALAAAVQHFSLAARQGGVPGPLRQRLARAGGQMAAQREALSRASSAMDRAMAVLLPDVPGATRSHVYGLDGQAGRQASRGSLQA